MILQSRFLSSGERPAASLKRDVQEPSSSEGARDVVTLTYEGSFPTNALECSFMPVILQAGLLRRSRSSKKEEKS